MVFKLDVCFHWWIDGLVDGLGLTSDFLLELFDVGECIHPRRTTISVITNEVPAYSNIRLLMIALFAQKSVSIVGTALRRGRSAPFPINFSEFEVFWDTKLVMLSVRLDCVRNNDFFGLSIYSVLTSTLVPSPTVSASHKA